MIKLRIMGDKNGGKFAWSMLVDDTRNSRLVYEAGGFADSEAEAKEQMIERITSMINNFIFAPIE